MLAHDVSSKARTTFPLSNPHSGPCSSDTYCTVQEQHLGPPLCSPLLGKADEVLYTCLVTYHYIPHTFIHPSWDLTQPLSVVRPPSIPLPVSRTSSSPGSRSHSSTQSGISSLTCDTTTRACWSVRPGNRSPSPNSSHDMALSRVFAERPENASSRITMSGCFIRARRRRRRRCVEKGREMKG